jgi:hypothetical protein
MTFRDYIYECENYQYSNEYYELMKECAELELMEKYLDNQKHNVYLPEGVTISDNYFMESVDDNRIQEITEAFTDKLKSFGTTVKNGFVKIVNILLGFLRKVSSVFDKFRKVSDVNRRRLLAKKIYIYRK